MNNRNLVPVTVWKHVSLKNLVSKTSRPAGEREGSGSPLEGAADDDNVVVASVFCSDIGRITLCLSIVRVMLLKIEVVGLVG